MSVALVPVKSLSAGKSRFLSQLSRESVEVLCVAMLEDVLAALLAAPSLERVVVATPDDRVAAAAEIGYPVPAKCGDLPGVRRSSCRCNRTFPVASD